MLLNEEKLEMERELLKLEEYEKVTTIRPTMFASIADLILCKPKGMLEAQRPQRSN